MSLIKYITFRMKNTKNKLIGKFKIIKTAVIIISFSII